MLYIFKSHKTWCAFIKCFAHQNALNVLVFHIEFNDVINQGLIQEEKGDISAEKGTLISTVAQKIVTQA